MIYACEGGLVEAGLQSGAVDTDVKQTICDAPTEHPHHDVPIIVSKKGAFVVDEVHARYFVGWAAKVHIHEIVEFA